MNIYRVEVIKDVFYNVNEDVIWLRAHSKLIMHDDEEGGEFLAMLYTDGTWLGVPKTSVRILNVIPVPPEPLHSLLLPC